MAKPETHAPPFPSPTKPALTGQKKLLENSEKGGETGFEESGLISIPDEDFVSSSVRENASLREALREFVRRSAPLRFVRSYFSNPRSERERAAHDFTTSRNLRRTENHPSGPGIEIDSFTASPAAPEELFRRIGEMPMRKRETMERGS